MSTILFVSIPQQHSLIHKLHFSKKDRFLAGKSKGQEEHELETIDKEDTLKKDKLTKKERKATSSKGKKSDTKLRKEKKENEQLEAKDAGKRRKSNRKPGSGVRFKEKKVSNSTSV